MNQTDERVRRAVEAVWRIEAPRLIAGLARVLGDIGLAEDLAQDALVAALEQWPDEGVPRNPGAWLMTVGKRRAVDLIRRDQTYARKLELVGRTLDSDEPGPEPKAEAIEDDLLRLVFTACHPVLAPQARVALTLRLLGGLSTADIARAYLVAEATIAQRIVRAKRLLAQKRVPFEVPTGAQLAERLSSVLEVVYLIFNEGYSATAGDDWMRPALCEDALRLARVLSGLMPAEPEVHGLTALLEIQASRVAARATAQGSVVLLADQDRGRWNQLLIRRGFSALAKADAAAKARGEPPGPYALQAAIAASHARALTALDTDWNTIAGLYDALIVLLPTPVVALNRAVAVAQARGPAAGLALVDEVAADDALKDYHLLPAVRADLLSRLGRYDEARAELERAAPLARNRAERSLLVDRAAALPR
ncbi:RNA polymerase sigma factor [Actinocrinis sp.]|uniref:RNA polymerase sigma factor n=1 Tax=Actinocrinis sp. TaxID=1920516 RepID=UPI002C9ED34D|nr:RNA polymerase sigma factor [Actinocrinis sp.]HXR70553.1 RNA polymerase sigma factor [Actinocrinis sp.]